MGETRLRIGRARVALLVLVTAAIASGLPGDRRVEPAPGPPPTTTPAHVASPWRAPRAIVLILIDTLRADHVGPRPDGASLTPELDRLARRSHVFEQGTATSSWTRSSIASIFTSRYPSSIRVLGRDDAIPDHAVTLAEVLRDAGWRTAAVFSNGNASPQYGFGQGFQTEIWPQQVRGYPGDFQKITAEGVTTEAIRALDEWRATAPASPFFLFVHYIDPHDPYLPHEELGLGPEPPGRFSGARPDLIQIDKATRRRGVAATDVARIKHLYAGEVRYCDQWAGRLLDAVERSDVAPDTLVVVTADHGEGLWDHDFRAHGSDLYQEQIHVPLIVHFPGMNERDARRIDEPVSLLDLAPTLLWAAGIASPDAFEGRDLGRVLFAAEPVRAGREIFAEMDLDEKNFETVRSDGTKLIRRRGWWSLVRPGIGLYDLATDPREHANVAGDGQHEATRRRLASALGRWGTTNQQRAGDRSVRTEDAISPELREQLRGLGYLQ